ncbi:hypothetical protein SAMN05444280_102191 [Tangfeifania diversioriginum]|uniref:Dolichyl-phosphate-mannose-protein mannosyltransferase n=1 Tax=Tangfeifania diversioriginum TaxID=1168035 RepID=A0A1M6BEJ5_9BACT|nr:hypothetical protein [Tangfeifania diversioriginum]SHI47162.1 hypothetical protein SAMN05444280_102191 [Tangfeifania diversioriginum]
MQKIKNSFSRIVIWFILAAVMLVNFSHHKWQSGTVIEHDVKAYYSYLPAAIIYNDLTLKFLDDDPQIFDEMWPVTLPNGNKMIVTSYGMSLLYSPFFLLAHGYSLLDNNFEADGYSLPYSMALNFSAAFYLLLGLFFLRKLLKRYFKEWIVALVLLAVAAGTNLAYYATYEAAMTHCYNFALITVFTWLVIKWYESPSRKNAIAVGALFGLIALVRPSNILVFFILLLWDVKSWSDFTARLWFYIKRFDFVLIMIILFFLVWTPQFFYWKTITGQWIFYSYSTKDASFFWGNPQIIDILFSYKKGWFVYTPIMLIAFLGIFLLRKRMKEAFWPILIFTILNIYVQSSWWSWWFGGAFGLRAFIDSYGIMALPLAMVLDAASQKKFLKYAAPAVLIVLIWYNTFQMRQYTKGAIHFWWNNKEAYWENFLRLHPTSEYWDMVRVPDYYLARKGIYEAVTPVEKRRRDLWRGYRDNYINTLKQNPQVIDSLKLFTTGVEKTMDEALKELASKRIGIELQQKEEEIKNRITSDKEWNKFVNKLALKNEIPYDSALNIEFKRIINTLYLK